MSIATIRSAALFGALSGPLGSLIVPSVSELTQSWHVVLRWIVFLALLVVLFYIPFEKWVIGENGFQVRDDNLHISPDPNQLRTAATARMGIWFIAGVTSSILVKLIIGILVSAR